ncbi:MAG: hypothetical protein AMXMBFR37_17070 [Steroidobacteraceae bacterium]
MATPKSWLPWAALAVVAALGGVWLARSTLAPAAAQAPQLQGGTWLPEPREVAAPALVDSRGAPFTQDSFTGHASVLFFGFTHCPDLCPTTMALLAQVRRTARTPFTVYLVSVDPERDTPEVLQAYLRGFDPEFIGLTGAPLDIKGYTRTFGAAVAKVELPGGSYTMDHSAALFLLDEHGRLRAIFTPPYQVESLAADLDAAIAATRG